MYVALSSLFPPSRDIIVRDKAGRISLAKSYYLDCFIDKILKGVCWHTHPPIIDSTISQESEFVSINFMIRGKLETED